MSKKGGVFAKHDDNISNRDKTVGGKKTPNCHNTKEEGLGPRKNGNAY